MGSGAESHYEWINFRGAGHDEFVLPAKGQQKGGQVTTINNASNLTSYFLIPGNGWFAVPIDNPTAQFDVTMFANITEKAKPFTADGMVVYALGAPEHQRWLAADLNFFAIREKDRNRSKVYSNFALREPGADTFMPPSDATVTRVASMAEMRKIRLKIGG